MPAAPMPLPVPTLHTSRLLLRPFAETDLDAIFALQSDPDVTRYWDAPPWKTRAQAERFIAMCRKMEEDGTGIRLAVARIGDGAFIGWCTLGSWNPEFRSARIGYCFETAAGAADSRPKPRAPCCNGRSRRSN